MTSRVLRLILVLVAFGLALGEGARASAAPLGSLKAARRSNLRGGRHLNLRRGSRHGGLRLRARFRLARMRFRHTRAARGLRHWAQGLGRAKRAFVHSRVGRRVTRVGRATGRLFLNVSVRLTQGADWVEHRLPPAGGRVFHALRALDPIALGAFAFDRIKRDPVFFATYGTWSLFFSNAMVPILMGVGLSPMVATVARLVTGTPVDLLAIAWRTHARRDDRSRSFWGTVRGLGHDYKVFMEARRARHRRLLAVGRLRSRAARTSPRAGALRTLGAAL